MGEVMKKIKCTPCISLIITIIGFTISIYNEIQILYPSPSTIIRNAGYTVDLSGLESALQGNNDNVLKQFNILSSKGDNFINSADDFKRLLTNNSKDSNEVSKKYDLLLREAPATLKVDKICYPSNNNLKLPHKSIEEDISYFNQIYNFYIQDGDDFIENEAHINFLNFCTKDNNLMRELHILSNQLTSEIKYSNRVDDKRKIKEFIFIIDKWNTSHDIANLLMEANPSGPIEFHNTRN